MKVKAIINFNDLKEKTERKIGDIFEVSNKRAEFLLENNAVEIVEEKIIAEEIPMFEVEELNEEIIETPIEELKAEIKLTEKPKKKKRK